MATGFQPTNYLARLESSAATAARCRSTGPASPARSSASPCPAFPNFFILYGPGTNGGEIVSMLERQAEYAVRAIKRMMRERVTAVEVKPRSRTDGTAWLQSTMEGTSWTMSNNYFTSPTGKVVTQWPYGNVLYRVLTKLLGRVSETTHRRT